MVEVNSSTFSYVLHFTTDADLKTIIIVRNETFVLIMVKVAPRSIVYWNYKANPSWILWAQPNELLIIVLPIVQDI